MARSKQPAERVRREYLVESLDLDAQGVAHTEDGKVVFIEGALPSECVTAETVRSKAAWEKAHLVQVLRESTLRVRPKCTYFGTGPGSCGGCSMQYLDAAAQVAIKQRTLEDNLWHLGKVKAQNLLRPLQGEPWGYRYRARLTVRVVAKKGGVLVGFHERASSYVADMKTCEILPRRVSDMLVPMRELIASLSVPDRLPQIELACGETQDDLHIALVLRHLVALTRDDIARLREFALLHGVQWWLQPKGPDSIHTIDDAPSTLAYALPEFGVTMPFKPTDFTQVNHRVNAVLVSRALRLLDVRASERTIDWFCGLGNFTLPIATKARQVLGVEGSEVLVARARSNAALNGLAERSAFEAQNLFELSADDLRRIGAAQKWLVDPPREGALALAKAAAELHEQHADEAAALLPQRIVYVSCNPATLARDAGLLVHHAGYALTHAGVVNMFPHTSHVESMAVFERKPELLNV
jgi:23S rRNA (uracil1939-C5)-methyltransferase